jgi:glycosyltransferase involved in cell wall biosynthesis
LDEICSIEVSVVLPVRDARPWLERCLASLAAQRGVSLEVIAVDDGSRDGSRAILESAARGKRLFTIVDSGGRGLVAALNLGLAAARARYLARMDADDEAHPDRLRRQLQCLQRRMADLVGCQARTLDGGAAAPGPRDGLAPSRSAGMAGYLAWHNSLLTPSSHHDDRFVECTVLHPTWMMATDAARALGGWHEEGWPEDWDFLLRASAAGWRLAKVGEELHGWRRHDGQASRRDPRYSHQAFARARCHYLAAELRERADDRALWVLGSGPTGKQLARGLAMHGVVVAGFADVDPRRIGNQVRWRDHAWPVIDSAALRSIGEDVLALGAVGSAAGRARLRALMAEWGWEEGPRFLACA